MAELSSLENQNPVLYQKCIERILTAEDENDEIIDLFDAREIFGSLVKILYKIN